MSTAMFQPSFMREIDKFHAERSTLKTLADWRTFQNKWFDKSGWPEKSEHDLSEEQKAKAGYLDLEGRRWGRTSWVYNLSASARYEYFWTLHMIGGPLRFNVDFESIDPNDGWSQECPYCEISTSQINGNICPICGRMLVLVQSAG